MNKLNIILTTIFSMVAYCAAMRNCTNPELYTTKISVSCSDELNRFTDISNGLVNYLAVINAGNFNLTSQVKVYNTYSYICISS